MPRKEIELACFIYLLHWVEPRGVIHQNINKAILMV